MTAIVKIIFFLFLILILFRAIVNAFPASVTPTISGGSLANTGTSPRPISQPDSMLVDSKDELKNDNSMGIFADISQEAHVGFFPPPVGKPC